MSRLRKGVITRQECMIYLQHPQCKDPFVLRLITFAVKAMDDAHVDYLTVDRPLQHKISA